MLAFILSVRRPSRASKWGCELKFSQKYWGSLKQEPCDSQLKDPNLLNEAPTNLRITNTAWKMSKYRVISGSYFPVFGLNMEIIYSINLCIQSEYRKKGIRNNSVFYTLFTQWKQLTVAQSWSRGKQIADVKILITWL